MNLRTGIFAALLMALSADETTAQQRFYEARAQEIKSFTNPQEPLLMYPMGGKLVIWVSTAYREAEMWVSDGTPSGTAMVKNGYSAGDRQKLNDVFQNFVSFKGKYYVSAPFRTGTDPNSIDNELTLTDLTPGGTTMVDIKSGNNSGAGPFGFIEFDGHVFFNAVGANGTASLHKHDGVSAPVAVPGLTNYMNGAVILNNELLLAGSNTTTMIQHGLYKLTSASATPTLVAEFSGIKGLQVLGNKAIFWGQKSTTDNIGRELYITDGTPGGTVLLKDIIPGKDYPGVTWIRNTLSDRVLPMFTVLNGNAYFIFSDGAGDDHIYRTDGTANGTVPVYTNSTLYPPIKVGNNIVFSTFPAGSTYKMAMTTDGITAPAPITAGGNKNEYDMTFPSIFDEATYDGNGNLLIGGIGYKDGKAIGNQLLISDGTGTGTKAVKIVDANTGWEIYTRKYYSVIGNHYYFMADNKVYKVDLNALSPVSVDDVETNTAKINLYPNPLHGSELTIETGSNYSGNGEITVCNINGIQVAAVDAKLNNGKAKIELPQLPQGNYSVKLITPKTVSISMITIQN